MSVFVAWLFYPMEAHWNCGIGTPRVTSVRLAGVCTMPVYQRSWLTCEEPSESRPGDGQTCTKQLHKQRAKAPSWQVLLCQNHYPLLGYYGASHTSSRPAASPWHTVLSAKSSEVCQTFRGTATAGSRSFRWDIHRG